MAAFVHPTAVVDSGASVGGETRIWHFCHVSEGAVIGPRCSLGQGVFVGKGVVLGAGVKVQNHVSIFQGVEIADDVFLGPSCVFTNVLHPRAFVDRKGSFVHTRVGKGATVGANATILCGRDLGEYCVVAAGSVVTESVASRAVVAGNPARRIGWACHCGETLPRDVPSGEPSTCARCGEAYAVSDDECSPLHPAEKQR